MNKERDFHYDPLYRVIDETEETQIIEGNFKEIFDRLKRINNLGIIPEVFEMARYPKYEHAFGTIYQINNLLDIVDERTIPLNYRIPLRLASIFSHLGHLPYTYSTERALLLASNLGNRNQENEVKKYILRIIKKVLDKTGLEEEKKRCLIERIFSLEDYKILYRYFSAEILIEKWKRFKNKIENLKDDDLVTIIGDLIDPDSHGYKYLDLADMADFVQRDALYFGTVRIDISPKHLYKNLTQYEPEFSTNEKKLIEKNLDYLKERFYENTDIIWFSRLYEKILASLIIGKTFKLEWLTSYNEEKLKRLITCRFDENEKRVSLPSVWTKRARNLFEQKISYSRIFSLKGILFPKEMDIIDVEYMLTEKDESKKGLLTYPFKKGILLDINYSEMDEGDSLFHQDYRLFSIQVFQDNSNKKLCELLKILKNLSCYLPISCINGIRKELAGQLSWTRTAELRNDAVLNALVEAIMDIERGGDHGEQDFVKRVLESFQEISAFDKFWLSYQNLWWYIPIYISPRYREKSGRSTKSSGKNSLYYSFLNGLLSLPIALLQYKSSTRKFLDQIYSKILELISSSISNGKTGHLFEALCLIEKMRTKRGKFQFFISGMAVIDPQKPKEEQVDNEFDIIELLINENEKSECWIYACSIADDYKSKNQRQITRLADHINSVFPDLVIRTRYMIPQNKNAGDWTPDEKDGGRNYN